MRVSLGVTPRELEELRRSNARIERPKKEKDRRPPRLRLSVCQTPSSTYTITRSPPKNSRYLLLGRQINRTSNQSIGFFCKMTATPQQQPRRQNLLVPPFPDHYFLLTWLLMMMTMNGHFSTVQ
jgi:hypothetical protein